MKNNTSNSKSSPQKSTPKSSPQKSTPKTSPQKTTPPKTPQKSTTSKTSQTTPPKTSPQKTTPKSSKTTPIPSSPKSNSFKYSLYLSVSIVVFTIIISIPDVYFTLPTKTSNNNKNIQDPPVFPPNLARKIPTWRKTVWAPFESYYLEILESCCGWKIIDDPFHATIMWTRDGPQKIDPERTALGEGQMWSLVEGTDKLTNKVELHFLLRNINSTYLQPETYVLSTPQECFEFFQIAHKNPDWVWVSKEAHNSMGLGMTINPNISDLRSLWLVDPSADLENIQCTKKEKKQQVLIQKYIRNPLLLNGKKMEIRTYWLIASVDPYIVLYHDGTVRLTSRDYKDSDWSDPLIHVTNTHQQKKADPNYHKTEHERKWTLKQMSTYLQNEGKIKMDGDVWTSEYLRPKLKEIIGKVASAVLPWLRDHKIRKGWDGRFELLGMDVILDSDLRPWLTEIQMGPSISLDPGVKEQMIPGMLEEMTDILLELDMELREGRKVSIPPISARNWQLVPLL